MTMMLNTKLDSTMDKKFVVFEEKALEAECNRNDDSDHGSDDETTSCNQQDFQERYAIGLEPQSAAQSKRKEKARIAARARRSQEASIIMEIAHELLITGDKLKRIDKATIVKLAIDYMKAVEVLCKFTGNPSIQDNFSARRSSASNSDSGCCTSIQSNDSFSIEKYDIITTLGNNVTISNNNDTTNYNYGSIKSDGNFISSRCDVTNATTNQVGGLSEGAAPPVPRVEVQAGIVGPQLSAYSNEPSQEQKVDEVGENSSHIPSMYHNYLTSHQTTRESATRQDTKRVQANPHQITHHHAQKRYQQHQPKARPQQSLPRVSTNSIFAPKTEDMDSYYLMINERDGQSSFVLKSDNEIFEEDDLTHLAPQAGELSITLDAEPLEGIVVDAGLFCSSSPPTKKAAPISRLDDWYHETRVLRRLIETID